MRAYLICDLQFGSCGKGLLSGVLAKRLQPDAVATAWAPNAGHVFVESDGTRVVRKQLGVATIAKSCRRVLIGPGSVIDIDRLHWEIDEQEQMAPGFRDRCEIIIHENAAVVRQRHRTQERETLGAIASTQQGSGAAMMDRMGRRASSIIARDWASELNGCHVVKPGQYIEAIRACDLIQIEGAQGFSLSIHHGFYPYVTARDTTPAQVMADCGLPWSSLRNVAGCLRTYPIRVGNALGYSGPCYPDQREIGWQDIGIPPEITTVTGRERRLFTFSARQLQEAIAICQPTALFVNFFNYLQGAERGRFFAAFDTLDRPPMIWEGYGPKETDVIWNHDCADW